MIKHLRVDISEIANAMESSFDGEHHHFLDLETGKLTLVLDEIISAVEDNDQETINDFPEWEKDAIEETRQILSDQSGRYGEVPTLLPSDGYRQMERLVETVRDTGLREKLEIALDGRGAFRRFKNVLDFYPEETGKWYKFKEERMAEDVLDWLESIGVKPGEATSE